MLAPDISAKLKDPAVKQAISFWVMQVVNQMGQVKSEKQIKKALLARFKMLQMPISETGVEFIYKLALEQFEAYKKSSSGIILNAN